MYGAEGRFYQLPEGVDATRMFARDLARSYQIPRDSGHYVYSALQL